MPKAGEWRVDGFTEVRDLGAGAHGRVVLARHATAGTPVAIKYLILRDGDEPALGRLRDEAVMLGRVRDPHVVRLYRFTVGPGAAALVMEAVDGVSLKRVLAEHGALGPEAALLVLKGSLLGLAAAHEAGVVHRDYKPANVVVRADGLSKLIDFGVATFAGERTGAGTPAYMAPEQWEWRPASAATDVYAATCVFVECVTGRRPFGGVDAAGLAGLHLRGPIPLDGVPEALADLVTRGMAKSPDDRPHSAAAFVEELERAASAAYGPEWERRGLRALAGAAVALAALFPLVAVGLAPAGAAGAAAGGAAGAGAASAGGGGILAAGGAKAAVAAVASAAVIAAGSAGVHAARSDGVGAAAPPAASPPATGAIVRKVSNSSTLSAPAARMTAEYPQFSGLPAALQSKINSAIRRPVAEWLRGGNKDILAFQPDEPATPYTGNVTYDVGLGGPGLFTVRYHFGGSVMTKNSRLIQIVIIDLRNGRVLGTDDLFRPEKLTATGMSGFTRLLGRHLPTDRDGVGDACDVGGPYSSEAEDVPLEHVSEGHLYAMPTRQGIEFYPPLFSMGYGMVCNWTMYSVPYRDLGEFIRPEIFRAAGVPVPSP
ncbi:serine/threonine-protein kinase [Actinomadura algeriensis]|uniref:non-specific serine/threonine protein kinase n=1 Tax=Actinomadura algeriensis TaxID=1679523 RepID=A0ABR9JW52_9ACTN|nr:serine/threonine-protein kinase [Actinomadura algeriensis]MBE1534360.1 serine/threonine-protein kinase [Actinomadura algeriensis]